MTNEEAIEILDRFAHHPSSEVIKYPREVAIEAFDMAIEALKAAPCEDCVSRPEVLNQIFYSTDNSGDVVLGSTLRHRIENLPPVTPKQRTGKWIKLQHNNDGSSRYMCSECGDTMQLSRHTFATFRFCPKCGAKMEG